MKAKECDDDNGLKFLGKKLTWNMGWSGEPAYELCPGVKDVASSL